MKIGDKSIETVITVLGAFKVAIKKTGKINVRSENEKEIIEYIDMAIDSLENQSKTNRWIPCEKRLPEKEGTYLVTRPNSGNWITDTMYFYRGSFSDKYVIAWQPIPEPYTENQKD